ncbi:Hypothetical protein A7982_07287 [Minicystis rosea]|nr:Hypothetical protein A7982_07287 [Minicystis rosea]
MIWNQWTRAPILTPAELLSFARAVMAPIGELARVEIEVRDDCVCWTVEEDDLHVLAERLDKADLSEDWEQEIDEADDGSYSIVIDVEVDEDVTSLHLESQVRRQQRRLAHCVARRDPVDGSRWGSPEDGERR